MKHYLNTEIIRHSLANLHLLTFEVTDACNLKCKYCGYGEFYEDYDERKNQYLRVDYAKEVLYYLTEYWKSEYNNSSQQRVYIGFYGGEPLLNMPFIKEIVEYVKNLDVGNRIFLEFSMTSNALLLSKKIESSNDVGFKALDEQNPQHTKVCEEFCKESNAENDISRNSYMDFIAENKFNLLISLDGNRENINLLELIYKEMLDNTSWRKVRNEHPCSDCLYQYLCPPISNYELAIGKSNLCNVK